MLAACLVGSLAGQLVEHWAVLMDIYSAAHLDELLASMSADQKELLWVEKKVVLSALKMVVMMAVWKEIH